MDTPINFELAKLLKEKGFNIPQLYFYIDGDISWKVDNTRCRNQIEGEYAAPTISEVVMWLYEKHGIWISVIDKNTDQTEWEFQTSKKGIGLVFSSGQYPPKFYNSPTEAYEAAIEYCLTNLIK
jgi:hypothetical protein